MPDVFTKRKRSEVMSRIRGRGNKETELALAKLLRKHGITGWRRHQPIVFSASRTKHWRSETPRRSFRGNPDFVFPRQRVAVFVDGCFWHGCPIHSNPARWLKKSSMKADSTSCSSRLRGESPSARTGRAFWTNKLRANIARDRFVTRQLRRQGWTLLRVWEHQLTRNPNHCIQQIKVALMPRTIRHQHPQRAPVLPHHR